MFLSSQTGNLFTTVEGAAKYAPVFKAAGFSALDYNFDALFPQGEVLGGKNFDLLDRPEEDYKTYFREISASRTTSGGRVGRSGSKGARSS